MSEVNYRRNGMKYSTTGKCWGMAPKAGGGLIETALPDSPKGTARPVAGEAGDEEGQVMSDQFL